MVISSRVSIVLQPESYKAMLQPLIANPLMLLALHGNDDDNEDDDKNDDDHEDDDGMTMRMMVKCTIISWAMVQAPSLANLPARSTTTRGGDLNLFKKYKNI